MSVSSGFFNSRNHDRVYSAEDVGHLFDGLLRDGVYASMGDRFAVSAREGMSISIGTGRAWFDHIWIRNDAPIVLHCDDAPQILKRIDTVVIDVDFSAEVRNADIIIVSGLESSNPQPKAMIHTESHNQYPLADILIDSNITSITQANITSRLGSSDCPFVTGIIEHGTIDNLISKWTTQFDDRLSKYDTAITDRIDELDEMISQAAAQSLIDNSVTTPKVANKAITKEKLADEYVETKNALSLEEISASTDLTGKVPSAQAVKDLNDYQSVIVELTGSWSNYKSVTLMRKGKVVIATMRAYKSNEGYLQQVPLGYIPEIFRPKTTVNALSGYGEYGSASAISRVDLMGVINIRSDGAIVHVAGGSRLYTAYASWVYFVD